MSLWRQLTRGLRVLRDRESRDRDIADEVAHYLDEATTRWEANGLSPEAARRAARQELGNPSVVREQVRAYGWENVAEAMAADLRYALRQMGRSPVFASMGVLTLALGIGASTAIFSAVNPVLLEPLPYPDAKRLMSIWDSENGTRLDVTFGTYRELLERSRSFESMAVLKPLQATLTGVDEPERLDGQYVSASYFRVLGVGPALGRDFEPSDDQPNRPFVALISDGLWRRRFGGDRSIVGRQILLEDIPVRVIGVLPGGFENVLGPSAEIWSPLQYDASLPLNGREWGHHLRMVGRLMPGVHPDRAIRELDTIARTRLADFPRARWAALPDGLITTPLQDDLTRSVKPALMAVVGAVILLLAIACVNVTNLVLARGAERRTELAVRAALGAPRWRIVRQLLTETLLIAAVGGVLGVGLAHLAVDALISMSPAELPRAAAIEVDNVAVIFALVLTSLIGLVIGVVPAIQDAGENLQGGIRQRSNRFAGSRHVAPRALVVAQVALALVLLVGAGLLVRSVQRLFAVPPGFDATNLLTMQVQAAGRQFRDPAITHQFFAQALEAIRQVPGVSGAASTSQLPLTGDEDIWGVQFESVPTSAGDESGDSAYRYAVSPGYFETMRIPLRKGRVLNSQDVAGAPLAVVINESFASRRFPGLDPIGQHVRVGPNSGFTVVGVVGDVKQTSLAVGQSDAVYMTEAQWHFADRAQWLVVRAERDTAALMPAIRHAIASIDKRQPILRVATMEERLKLSAAERRFALLLFEAFGLVALILAAIGTYSLLSVNVTARTREMGVRSVLGATRPNILVLVIRQGMVLAGLGIAVGAAGALVASRALVTLLFGISPLDFTTYAGVIALLAGVSAVACAIPAWRAARVRPSTALRAE